MDGWKSLDPSLSELGRKQSEALALVLKEKINGNEDIVSSPFKRCLETSRIALPDYKANLVVNSSFSELPSPISDLNKRVDWLKTVLPLTWDRLDKNY